MDDGPDVSTAAEISTRGSALHTYLDTAFERERDRFRQAEEKIARYLKVAAIVGAGAGVAALQIKTAIPLFGQTRYAAFVIVYGLGLLSLLVAVVGAAAASRVENTAALPTDDDTVDAILTLPFAESMKQLACTYIACIDQLRKINERRYRAVAVCFYATCAAIFLGLVALVIFIVWIPVARA